MAEFELVHERTISGKGMLRVPSEIAKRRMVVLYSDVIRKPTNPYLNLNYSPYRSRYGFVTFLRNEYVIGTAAIEFEKQSFDGVTDITSQNLIAIKCMYKGVLQSFINFATAMALPVIEVTDTIKDYEYLDLLWDEVRVVCYSDTALNLRLYTLPLDKCQEDADKPRKPPKPPPPPPPVPPGTPIPNIDPPYEDEDNPDNFTEPFEGDETSEFPIGETCTYYNVTLDITEIGGNVIQGVFQVYGEIDGAGVGNDGRAVFITCRGGIASIDPPAGECLPELTDCYVFGSTEPAYVGAVIVDVQPV